MTNRSRRFAVPVALGIVLFCLANCITAHAQILNQDTEIQVPDLPSLMARTHDRLDVLLTSLDTVFNDKAICCGKDSALEDNAAAADPKSLPDVAAKLNGRHLLSDGRPILVRADYRSRDAVNSGDLISSIMNQHAVLLQWNSRVYVVHGVVYRWYASGGDPEGGMMQGTLIRKLLLWDTRYAGDHRNVVFDRDTDGWSNVQGVLFLQVSPQ